MAEKPVRIGIIGASPKLGWARHSHLPAIHALPEYELAAVCTASRESADEAARQFQAPVAFWDYRDLIKDASIDAVVVTVRAPLHHEIVMAALERGKHVYCEWPLATTAQHAQEMADMAARRNLRNMVGLQSRGDPSLVHMRDLIAKGWIGDVVSARMGQLIPGLLDPRHPTRLFRADKANATNSLTKDGGHAFDAFCWTVGPFAEFAAVVSVRAPEWPVEGGQPVAVTGPDHVSVTGLLASGAVASVVVATVPWHAPGVRIEVYGTEGTLLYTTHAKNVNRGTGHLQGARHRDASLKPLEPPPNTKWAPAGLPMADPFKVGQMLRTFAEAICSGRDASPTFAEAAAHQRLLEAIDLSSQTRCWISWDGKMATASVRHGGPS
jgi:predicted dehydrogenase